jgi:hypothetical protein
METQKCTMCKETKNINMFGKNKETKSGYKYRCKACETETQRLRREKEKAEDPEKYHKKWADYYAKTKEHNYEMKKAHLSIPENRIKRNDYIRKYKAQRRLNDKSYVLYENLRKKIWKSLSKKSNSSKELLGCEIDYYFKWINYTMTDDMNWDNYGTYWNIDHLIPVNTFNIIDPNEALKAFNWKNTWAMKCSENFSKNDTIIYSQLSKHKELLDEFVKLNKDSEIGNQQPSVLSKGDEGSETR